MTCTFVKTVDVNFKDLVFDFFDNEFEDYLTANIEDYVSEDDLNEKEYKTITDHVIWSLKTFLSDNESFFEK